LQHYLNVIVTGRPDRAFNGPVGDEYSVWHIRFQIMLFFSNRCKKRAILLNQLESQKTPSEYTTSVGVPTERCFIPPFGVVRYCSELTLGWW